MQNVEKNAILLHGFFSKNYYHDPTTPSPSNAHWFPWLQKQLMIHDIKTDTPEVFKGYEQVWENWVTEIERFPINENTILIGHSMGGGALVRYLTEHPDITVDSVILVAPWLNLDKVMDTNFLDFTFNPVIVHHARRFIILASDDDHQTIQKSTQFLKTNLPSATYIPFHAYGHFTSETMPSNTFPELLQLVTTQDS